MATVIERIARALYVTAQDKYEPFEIELVSADWDALHQEMADGATDEGWPLTILGVPFTKIHSGKSSVVARQLGVPMRANFLL